MSKNANDLRFNIKDVGEPSFSGCGNGWAYAITNQAMRKTITKRMAKTLEIEVSDTGFTVWIKDGKSRHWVLDGSCLTEDGTVRLGKSDIYKHRAEYDKAMNEVRITRKP